MSKLLASGQGRIVLQICAVGAVAALMSGCSADSTRFGDAFGNPFATGSIQKPKPKHVAVRKPPITGTGVSAPIVSSALPPRGATAAYVAPVRQPPAVVSHEATGSIGPTRSVAGNSSGGWSGQGGASVTIGQGDSAAILAQRYGVPENVLLQVNGLHAASEIQPGGQIVVPIYNAVASTAGSAPRVVERAPRVVEAAPVREPAIRPAPDRVAEAEPAEPAPVKVEREEARTEKADHAAREAAARKVAADKAASEKVAADKAAGEKLAAAQKVAAAEKVALAEAAAAHRAAADSPAGRAQRIADLRKLAEARRAATAEKAAAAQTAAAAAREAAKAKADALKAASAAAKAPKVAVATPAPVAPAPAVVPKKPVDDTPTASVPPATADAAAAGGPEFRWPARGRIIAGFKGGAGGNDGINIAVPDGTPVKAAEGGVVAYAGSELKGYGNLVLIKHPNGFVTAYANNGEIDVKRGDTVKRGQTIAKSGQSGNVASPQLHFELRKGSQPVDPTNYLAGL